MSLPTPFRHPRTDHAGTSLRRRADKHLDYVDVGPPKATPDLVLAGLLRVSGKGQENNYSLAAQRKAIIDIVEQWYVGKHGMSVRVHFYADVNPHDTANRPMIDQVVREIASRRLAHAWVAHLDRFERGDFWEFARYKIKLEDRGLVFNHALQTRDPFDPPTLADDMMQIVTVLLATHEKKRSVARVKTGSTERQEQGLVTGTANTFGLQWVDLPGQKRAYQIPHPDEAIIVREIFRLYRDEERNLRALAKRLNAQLVPTLRPTGGNRSLAWSASTLSLMLGNEAYIGRAYTNIWVTLVDEDGEKRQVRRPREEWRLVPLGIRPDDDGNNVVPDDLFFEVARLRASRRHRQGRDDVRDTLLLTGGLVRCLHCGLALARNASSPRPGQTYVHYRCRNRAGGSPCYEHGGADISTDLADRVAWDAFERLMRDPDQIRRAFAVLRADDSEARARMAQLLAEVEAADNVIAGARTTLAAGLDASLVPTFTAMLNDAAASRARALANVRHEQARLSASDADLAQLEGWVHELGTLDEEARALLGDWPLERKRRLLRRFRVVTWVGRRPHRRGAYPVVVRAHVTLPTAAPLLAEDADGVDLTVEDEGGIVEDVSNGVNIIGHGSHNRAGLDRQVRLAGDRLPLSPATYLFLPLLDGTVPSPPYTRRSA